VKQCFRQLKSEDRVELLTRKPVQASEEEIERNRRARSAKLRAARLIR
jgi:16S rRNA (cytosine1402-N4)-methyltransferase